MKGIGLVLVGGMMVLGQEPVLGQDVPGTSPECVTCARWESYRHVDSRRFERGFLGSLNHEVDGVVEAAIREVALIKMAQPQWQSSRVADQLHRLATGDRPLAVRIKASLAEAVFTEGIVFGEGGYRTDEEVFSAIVQELYRQRDARAAGEAPASIAGR